MTVELVADLQHGKIAGGAERLARIAKLSFGSQLRDVCLACTELPQVFATMKTLATFEQDGTVFISSNVVHINAAFNFAVEQESGRALAIFLCDDFFSGRICRYL